MNRKLLIMKGSKMRIFVKGCFLLVGMAVLPGCVKNPAPNEVVATNVIVSKLTNHQHNCTVEAWYRSDDREENTHRLYALKFIFLNENGDKLAMTEPIDNLIYSDFLQAYYRYLPNSTGSKPVTFSFIMPEVATDVQFEVVPWTNKFEVPDVVFYKAIEEIQ